MTWYGMAAVYEGAQVAMCGWVLADRHNLALCAAVCRRFGQPYTNDSIDKEAALQRGMVLVACCR